MARGTLFAIGTGPGASDLLTLRAVNILSKTDVILAAASPKNDYSICMEIVRDFLPPTARLQRLDFPMTRDTEVLADAWMKAAHTTIDILNNGQNAVFLTIGDPLVYSTFTYLSQSIKKLDAEVKIQIVPGITSFQAAAAKAEATLCIGRECLQIVSGILPEVELERILTSENPAVILKAYKNFPAIRQALVATGRLEKCLLASFVERKDESISPAADWKFESAPPYMSLIISPGGKRD